MNGRAWGLVLVGVVAGAALLHSLTGMGLGLLLGWLLADHWNLHERLTRLERDRTAGPQPADTRPAPDTPPQAAAETEPLMADTRGIADLAADRPGTPPVPASPMPGPARISEPDQAFHADAEPGVLAGLGTRLLAFLGGGNVLVRIGVLLLFFGVAFLLKYVSQTVTVPLELRFAGVALFGLALLGLGWRLRARRPAYAMVVQGGGVGMLYLTVFVATRFGLLPAELAFALLVAVALLSALLALGQDASALAVFGAAGGFLAPVLTATDGGSHVQLFGYYAVLNAGILGLAWHKSWRTLNLVGFVFTFVISGLWGHRYYRSDLLATTEPFLVLFFLMYTAVAVLSALRQPLRLKGYVDGPLVFGLPAVAFGLQAGLVRHIDFALAWSAATLSGFYLILAATLWRRHGPGLRLLCEAFLALGVTFLTLAVPLALDARWTAAAWALEGAALVWVGLRQSRLAARIVGLLLQLLAGASFAAGWVLPARALPVLNGRCLGGLLIALAGLLSSWYLHNRRESLRAWERPLPWAPLLWGLLWWYGTGLHEIDRFVPKPEQFSAALLLLSAGAALATALRRPLAWPQLGVAALLLLPAAALVLASARAGLALFATVGEFMPLVGLGHGPGLRPYHPFAGIGWLAWPAVFAAHYRALWRLDADFPHPRLRRIWHAGALWLLAWVLTWELARTFHLAVHGQGSWALAVWGGLPAGLALWVLKQGPRVLPWPCARFRDDYLWWGAGPLMLFVLGWSVAANLHNSGDAAPLPWLPLLNPLDLAMAFAALGGLSWWLDLRREQPERANGRGRVFLLTGAAAGFLWLNAAVARGVHHLAGVSFRWHALLDSGVFQSAVSLLWSSLALVLMAWSARTGRRTWWLAGAVLLGLVVLKLFLVELADSGTLTRIVSFLGVGGLLLLIGYLAPLPPREAQV